MYRVFTRNWWKIENGKKVPDSCAEKTYLEDFEEESEARAFCMIYNNDNEPGILSNKAEYEEY